MTDQEAFTQVVRHLLKQGRQSLDAQREKCAYRGAKGLQCAIGCLIPDKQYQPCMEGEAAGTVQARVRSLQGLSTSLLMNLQEVHDTHADPASWRIELLAIAKLYGLAMPDAEPSDV
jgi:hypothetical protein